MQTKIRCVLMRGGTSRGPFFLASDLPADEATRDKVLLAVMGSPHGLQVDGLGGGHPLTSKVAIISRSARPDADIDFLFAQVAVDRPVVDTSPNCGNMIAGVGPFAIEEGLVEAQGDETRVRIHNRNTGAIVDAFVQTPGGHVEYAGTTTIDGVGGTAAPVKLNFMNAAGSKTGALFPSGKLREEIDGIPVSLVDYAMPMMLLPAQAVGIRGDESAEELDKRPELLATLERLRLEAGRRMGLGDVTGRVIPKVGVLSKGKFGALTSRYFVPDRCHKAHAVTGAVCIATAGSIAGTVAADIAETKPGTAFVLEHPSGRIDIDLDVRLSADPAAIAVERAAVIRTTRRIFEGNVLVPAGAWPESDGIAEDCPPRSRAPLAAALP